MNFPSNNLNTNDFVETEDESLPSSKETEQAILGGLLLDNEAFHKVVDLISKEDFFKLEHRMIFEVMQNLMTQNRPFDAYIISEEILKNHTFVNPDDLKEYLAELERAYYTTVHIEKYASIIREKFILRQLIHLGNQIARDATYTEGRSAQDVLELAENSIFNIRKHTSAKKQDFLHVKDVIVDVLEELNTLIEQRASGELTGLPTGFIDLDKITAGMHPGHLVIIAARPAMGKTAFSLNIAYHMAFKTKKNVLIFSLEMSATELVKRLLSSAGSLNYGKLRDGDISTDKDWEDLTTAMGVLHDCNIFIDATSSLTPLELRARARKLFTEHGDIGLIVVDYLQLMSGNSKNANRVNEVSEISRSLKILAKDLNCPIIALSQLNRSLEQRPNKRPMMSDLRESGALEQDADLILFIYRDEVYDPESPDKGIAEIILGKNRHGATGTVKLTFLGQYTRFENYANPDEYGGGDYNISSSNDADDSVF